MELKKQEQPWVAGMVGFRTQVLSFGLGFCSLALLQLGSPWAGPRQPPALSSRWYDGFSDSSIFGLSLPFSFTAEARVFLVVPGKSL